MSNQTITYATIKSIDIMNAMDCSARSTSASLTVAKNDSNAWYQTVAQSMELYVPMELDGDKEAAVKQVREKLAENMASVIYGLINPMPETGKDRDGKTIMLLNSKTNTIKWSSWEKTRRIWAYLGDIAKVIVAGLAEDLYPESMKVAARCDILAACKGSSTPIENVRRLVNQVTPYIAELKGADSLECNQLLGSIVVPDVPESMAAATLIANLDRLITASSGTERADIQSLLFSMATRHFA